MSTEHKITSSPVTFDYDLTVPLEKIDQYSSNPKVQNDYACHLLNAPGKHLVKSLCISKFFSAAKEKYAPALFNLGLCYAEGIGIGQHLEQAVRYYQLAAQQNHARAQNRLGVCYESGIGVKQDDKEALRLYTLAANQGIARAQYNVGLYYHSGRIVEKNIKRAAYYYQLAAEQGDALAQKRLAEIYETKTARANKEEYKIIKDKIVKGLEAMPLAEFKQLLIDAAKQYLANYQSRTADLITSSGKKRAENLRTQLRTTPAPKGFTSIPQILGNENFFGDQGGEEQFSFQPVVCRALIARFAPEYKGIDFDSGKDFIKDLKQTLHERAAVNEMFLDPASKSTSKPPLLSPESTLLADSKISFFDKQLRIDDSSASFTLNHDPLDELPELEPKQKI
ncbi:MAG: tetratricopeptide repeat protein [Gammaproteobacteria bacterium]